MASRAKITFMQTTSNHLEKLTEAVTDLAETKIELMKLKAAGKISASLSALVAITMILVFSGAALTILSFGISYWIGSRLNSIYAGFFIVGGFYALAGLLFYIKRKKWVSGPLSNFFIDKLM
jgi:uncharacterized membrane protein YqjE